MKKYIILLYFVSISFFCFAQVDYIYLNNNKFVASEKMTIYCNESYDYIYIRIALDNNAGLLELSFKEITGDIMFTGSIQIFLENGNFIRCNDYGYRDVIGGLSSMIYKLTKSELDYLRKYNISKIRYSIAQFNDYNNSYSFKHDYIAVNDYIRNYDREKKIIHVNTAQIINKFVLNQSKSIKNHDYNALFGATSKKTSNTKYSTSKITVKPNHAEFGRKYGKRSVPTSSGKINSMTVVFTSKSVVIYDNIETATFVIIDYEWMDGNLLWIDFSSKPQEFYMVIAFDSDGLVIVNNENDPQPGEEYKSLYFKELSRSEFKNIYK